MEHVALRVRLACRESGCTMIELGRQTGVSQQLMFRYTTARARIWVGLLYQMAGVLGVPIGYFYDGLGGVEAGSVLPIDSRAMEFAQDVMSIKHKGRRQRMYDTTRVLANGEQKG